VLPFGTPPRLRFALRLTAFAVQIGFAFSMALVVADLASQLVPPRQRALWFGIAGGTAALGFWRMWGVILKRVGIK
jgi:hypothetical protein